LAAALAHCLNSESLPVLQLEPGALYARLIDLLAARYAEALLHHPVYAQRMSQEEAASHYFDATIARRLTLSGSVQLSIAHRLFSAMCQRGADRVWRDSTVAREPAAAAAAAKSESAADIGPVMQRLEKLPREISSGSASLTLRARHGPVVLRVDGQPLPVPEEIAAWDAIVSGPSALLALAPGEPFNRFCSLMIDCIRTANRPVQEILGLGRRLCPFDWLDVLSIQQMRALKRFLHQLQAADAVDSPKNWAEAFENAPVPGFKNAADLWDSEIGGALRNGTGHGLRSSEEWPELSDPNSGIDEFLAEQDFLQQLKLLENDQLIDAVEHRLLEELYRGTELEVAAQRAEVRMALRARGLTLEQLLTDIQQRVDRWRAAMAGANGNA
jgi:hypothetical protein